MTHRPLRRATAAAAVLSLSLVLAACGGDDAEEGTDDPTSSATTDSGDDDASETPDDETGGDDTEDDGQALGEDELEQALLTLDDLPGGYQDDPDDGDDDGGAFEGSCLEEIDDIFDADEEAETAYLLPGDAGQSGVRSVVQSYADEQQLVTAIQEFSETVAACPEATGTNEEGLAFDLQVESDQTVSLTGVDEQARVAVSGTITTGELELAVSYGYNAARIAGDLVIINTLDLGEIDAAIVEQTDELAQVSVDRLAEVTGG